MQPSVAILIPAYNEAATVAQVVQIAIKAKLGQVLVVDDGSTDTTAFIVSNIGAEVLKLKENLGKAGAVYEGASFLDTDILLLIDADLIGLKPQHLIDLVKPLLTKNIDMTRGEIPDLQTQGYGLEVTIAKVAQKEKWLVEHVPLNGVSQIMKEEKEGRKGFKGFLLRLDMYWQIIRSALR